MTSGATWSFYDPATGSFVGRTYRGADLAANTPAGCAAIEGRFDHRTQRVDLATGQVVAWEPPPQPAAEARDRALRLRAEIAAIEQATTPLRALREAVLALAAGLPVPAESAGALATAEAAIAPLRERLRAGP